MKNLQPATLLLPLLAVLLLSSCSPTLSPFTQQLYDTYRWDSEDLSRIQFYLSDDIVLRKEQSGGSSEIVAGEIKVVEGRQVEEVFFPRGTPGVFLFSPKTDRLAISFEGRKEDEDKYLMFGPNPKMGDRYVLLGANWDRRRGTVTYDGNKYRVESSNAFAGLLVDLKKIRRESRQVRTARGRRVLE